MGSGPRQSRVPCSPVGKRFDEDAYKRAQTAVARALTDRELRTYRRSSPPTLRRTSLHTASTTRLPSIRDPPPSSAPLPSWASTPTWREGPRRSRELDEAPSGAPFDIRPGEPFSTAALDTATQALLDLEVFSAVQMVPTLTRTRPPLWSRWRCASSRPSCATWRLGGGFEFDEIKTDLHALIGWENHNFLGGLRDFNVEFKPGVIPYPTRLGNYVGPTNWLGEERLRVQFRQPGFPEPRTSLFVRPETNVYTMLVEPNPDPNQTVIGYVEPKGAVGLERRFGRHFLASLGHNVQGEIPFVYVSPEGSSAAPLPPNIILSYPQLVTTLDFRDNPTHPHSGFYLSNNLQVAFLGSASDIREQPEVRGYVPVARGITLAARGSVGFLFPFNYGNFVEHNIGDAVHPPQDDQHASQRLNDYIDRDIEIAYFRGFFSGGPSSNRGYPLRGIAPHGVVPFLSPATAQQQVTLNCVPNQPGYNAANCSIPIGGFTQWEASAEVRFAISGPFGVATFCDAGDVSAEPANIRLDHLHLSCGAGARYDTPVGPVRLDIGARIPPLQVLGFKSETDAFNHDPTGGLPPTLFGLPIAIAFGIGEAFLMPRFRAGAVFNAIGAGGLFAAALVGGVLVHLDLPTTRRLVRVSVNDALATTFEGRLTIDRIGGIGSTGVDGVDAHVDDANGRLALRVEGLRARVSTGALVRSLLGHGPVVIGIPEASVSRAEVSIDADGSAVPRIARAFAVRPSATPSSASGPGIVLSIPRAHIEHAAVHGTPRGTLAIDADVDALDGAFGVTGSALSLDVLGARITARSLPPGVDTKGTLEGHFGQPSSRGGDRDVRASWRGTVGTVAGDGRHCGGDSAEVDGHRRCSRRHRREALFARSGLPRPIRVAPAAGVRMSRAHGALP